MPWKDVGCLIAFLVGVITFLYGANFYDLVLGWSGIGLAMSGFFAYVLMKIYGILTKK
jgi:hypothetical protein